MSIDEALALMARDVGTAFEPAAFAALEAVVGGRVRRVAA